MTVFRRACSAIAAFWLTPTPVSEDDPNDPTYTHAW